MPAPQNSPQPGSSRVCASSLAPHFGPTPRPRPAPPRRPQRPAGSRWPARPLPEPAAEEAEAAAAARRPRRAHGVARVSAALGCCRGLCWAGEGKGAGLGRAPLPGLRPPGPAAPSGRPWADAPRGRAGPRRAARGRGGERAPGAGLRVVRSARRPEAAQTPEGQGRGRGDARAPRTPGAPWALAAAGLLGRVLLLTSLPNVVSALTVPSSTKR